METKFKIGDVVRYTKCDYTKEYIGKYFRVIGLTNTTTATVLNAYSIDNRLLNKCEVGLFSYKWKKVSKEEYIILKLKGVVE